MSDYHYQQLNTRFYHTAPQATWLKHVLISKGHVHYHYSSQLQTWLQTWFSTRFAARFSTSSCGFATCFRHAFDFFCRKTWSRTCCINLDMSKLMQQVRWFVHVLDKRNVQKTVSSQPTNLLKLNFRYVLSVLLFVLIMT